LKTFIIITSAIFLSCSFLTASSRSDKLNELNRKKAELDKTLNPIVLLLIRTLYIHNEQKVYHLNENSQIPRENVLVKFVDPFIVVAHKPGNRGIVVTRAIVKDRTYGISQQNLYVDLDLKGKKYNAGSKITIDKVLIVTDIKPDVYENIPNIDHSLYPVEKYLEYIKLCREIISYKKSEKRGNSDSISFENKRQR